MRFPRIQVPKFLLEFRDLLDHQCSQLEGLSRQLEEQAEDARQRARLEYCYRLTLTGNLYQRREAISTIEERKGPTIPVKIAMMGILEPGESRELTFNVWQHCWKKEDLFVDALFSLESRPFIGMTEVLAGNMMLHTNMSGDGVGYLAPGRELDYGDYYRATLRNSLPPNP